MSGIVRGFISGDVAEQMYGFTVVTVNNIPFTRPVAVVPLYDATLAACVERACQYLYASGASDVPNEAERIREILCTALGLGGEGA